MGNSRNARLYPRQASNAQSACRAPCRRRATSSSSRPSSPATAASRLGEGCPPSVHPSIRPLIFSSRKFRPCAHACSTAGMKGTAANSQVFPTWTFASTGSPRRRAAAQCRRARGPGPSAERLYSPTCERIPPRSISTSHSLTLMIATSPGRRSTSGCAHASAQPQSQAINR